MTNVGRTQLRDLPMFPLGTVLFPEMPLLLHVFEQRYRALVRDCTAGDREFGVVLITRGSEVGGGDERSDRGTVARIDDLRSLDDGRYVLAARGLERLQVEQWLPDDPYPRALIRPLPSQSAEQGGAASDDAVAKADDPDVAAAEAAVRRTRALLSELGQGAALPPDLELDRSPELALWQLCRAAPLSPFDAQRLLELDPVPVRARLLVTLMDQLADDLTRLLTEEGRERPSS